MGEMEADDNHVTQQLLQAEAHLGADTLREAHQRLQKSIGRLRKEKDGLVEESRALQMDPEQARAMMLQEVKDDKTKLDSLSKQLRNIEEENLKHQKTMADLTTDLAERKGEGGDTQKYDVLFERDKEMEEQKKIQSTVVDLLAHISEGVSRSDPQSMPSKAQVGSMRDDLTFKQRQLDSAEGTKNRLSAELKKRNVELEKINTLDEKIV